MCTLSTIYLLCSHPPCSRLTSYRPALTLCSRARRRNYLLGPLTNLVSNTPVPVPVPCRAGSDVAITTHFAFTFGLCEACLSRLVPEGAERDARRARTETAWGPLPVVGRRALPVDFVDVYERMVGAGAVPRDVTSLVQRLEVEMWEEMRGWFREVARTEVRGGDGVEEGETEVGAGGVESNQVGLRQVGHSGYVSGMRQGSGCHSGFGLGGEEEDVDDVRRSPETQLAHDMFWQAAMEREHDG